MKYVNINELTLDTLCYVTTEQKGYFFTLLDVFLFLGRYRPKNYFLDECYQFTTSCYQVVEDIDINKSIKDKSCSLFVILPSLVIIDHKNNGVERLSIKTLQGRVILLTHLEQFYNENKKAVIHRTRLYYNQKRQKMKSVRRLKDSKYRKPKTIQEIKANLALKDEIKIMKSDDEFDYNKVKFRKRDLPYGWLDDERRNIENGWKANRKTQWKNK